MKKLTKEQMEIVKSEHPEWFRLKDSTWYIKPSNGTIQFNVKDGHGYGWCLAHGWVYDARWLQNDYDNEFREATPEEVKSALIAEAKRRYKVGDIIKSIRNDWVHTIGEMHVDVYSLRKERNYWVVTVVAEEDEWNKMCSNPAVFKDGQWASVLPQEKPTLQDDIQALKGRWPDINFTIIAEGRK